MTVIRAEAARTPLFFGAEITVDEAIAAFET
jgi:hypothetical protein